MMHRLGERRRHPGAGIRSRRRSEVCLPGADSTPMGLACGAGVRPEPGNRLHSGPIRTRRTPRAWPWETMWGALATPGEKAAKPHTVPPTPVRPPPGRAGGTVVSPRGGHPESAPARSLPGCPGQRRRAWDVRRGAPRAGQPAPRRAHPDPPYPQGMALGDYVGGAGDSGGKGRQAPHSPTERLKGDRTCIFPPCATTSKRWGGA